MPRDNSPGQRRREFIFEPGANGDEPITLDPETRERFVRALAKHSYDALMIREREVVELQRPREP